MTRCRHCGRTHQYQPGEIYICRCGKSGIFPKEYMHVIKLPLQRTRVTLLGWFLLALTLAWVIQTIAKQFAQEVTYVIWS